MAISYIPKATTLAKGGSEFDIVVEYQKTNSILNDDGKAFNLPSDKSFQRLDVDFVGKYGFTEQLEGMVGVKGRVLQAEFVDNFGDGEQDYQLTSSGGESFALGFEFGFTEEAGSKISIEGWYRQALYSLEEFDGTEEPTTLTLGNGTSSYAIGANYYIKTKSSNVLEARAFYQSPSENLSKEIFSEFQYALVWENASVYAGVENVLSLGNDPYTNDEGSKPLYFPNFNYHVNSLNRSWTAPYIGLNISMGMYWRLRTRLTQVTTGQSVDVGPRVLIALTRRADAKTSEYQKRDESFKQYTVEGAVVKMSKNRRACVIDRGVKDGLQRGTKIDFYHFDFVGGNKLIARGVVIKARASKSVVRISKRFSRKRVEVGTVARGGEIVD